MEFQLLHVRPYGGHTFEADRALQKLKEDLASGDEIIINDVSFPMEGDSFEHAHISTGKSQMTTLE